MEDKPGFSLLIAVILIILMVFVYLIMVEKVWGKEKCPVELVPVFGKPIESLEWHV